MTVPGGTVPDSSSMICGTKPAVERMERASEEVLPATEGI
jgi:hypothetical protein